MIGAQNITAEWRSIYMGLNRNWRSKIKTLHLEALWRFKTLCKNALENKEWLIIGSLILYEKARKLLFSRSFCHHADGFVRGNQHLYINHEIQCFPHSLRDLLFLIEDDVHDLEKLCHILICLNIKWQQDQILMFDIVVGGEG